MAKCPSCSANLGPSDLLALKCPACSASLASLPELDPAVMQTINEQGSPGLPVDRTIDESTDMPAGGLASLLPTGGIMLDESSTMGDSGVDQTLAAGEIAPPVQEQRDTGTVADARNDQTLQSADMPFGSLPDAPVAAGPDQDLHKRDDQSTLSEARFEQTLESGTFPPLLAAGPESPPDAHGSRAEQTLDSDVYPPVAEEKQGGTVKGVRLDQTLDSGSFAPVLPPAGPGTVYGVGADRTIEGDAPVAEREGGTVSNRRLDQTLDSAEFAAAAQDDEKKTVNDRKIAQTLDSVDSVSDLGSDEPKTLEERRHAATIDSAELSSADMIQVSQMWEGSLGRDVTPMTSIKSKSPQTEVPENTLVIAPRVFRGGGTASGKPADYDLVKQLGEGGMGIVYEGKQMSIDRKVAVKMLKPKTAKDKVQKDKFLAEAVVTGELDHPNIVPIYDLGKNEEGALFYSMKKVEGKSWMDEIKKKSLHENIEILMKVADGIAFAHSRSVVHRDLKPENIMLGGFGEVLVMDWGLAIYTTRNKRPGGIKQSTSMGGTPAYMAPEMASGPFERISPASDIYLLGAMLYEIITGKPPHTGTDVMKCLFAAAKNQIQPTEVKSELVDIALKAMATKIEDRHPTVQEFQNAIREYLSHSESIALSTQADNDLERARKTDDYQAFALARFGFEKALEMWGGNHRAQSGLSEAKLANATSALARGDFDLGLSMLDAADPDHLTVIGQLKSAQQEREARQRHLKTMRQVVRWGTIIFFIGLLGGMTAVTLAMLKAVAAEKVAQVEKDKAKDEKAKADVAKEDALQQKSTAEIAKSEAQASETKAKEQQAAAEKSEMKAKDQQMIAETATMVAKEEEKKAIKARDEAKYQEYIAVIGLAQAKIDENAHETAKDMLKRYEGQPDLTNWEWGRLMRLCNLSKADFNAQDRIEAVALEPQGKRFVEGGWNGEARIWNVADADQPKENRKPVVRIPTGGSRVLAVGFSIEGVVATGGTDKTLTADNKETGFLKLWDAATGKLLATLDGHKGPVLSIAFSDDGKLLLTASKDGVARLWNMESRTLIMEFKGHEEAVYGAALSPRKDSIVTVSEDGTALVWTKVKHKDWEKDKSEEWKKSLPFYGHEGPIYSVAFSPDGSRVATAGYDKRVLLWEPEVEQYNMERHSKEYRARSEELNQLKRQKITGAAVDAVLAKLAKLKVPLQQKVAELAGHTDRVQAVRFSADGRFLFSAGHDNAIVVWDAGRAWSEGSLGLLKTLRGHGNPIRACAVNQDGSLVISGSYDQTARLWDVRKYEETRVLTGAGPRHDEQVLAAAFAPAAPGDDEMRIVTASHDRTAKIWKLDKAQGGAALVQDERFVVDKTLEEGHAFLAQTAIFFAKGTRLLTCGADNTARIWDVDSGTQLRELKGTGDSPIAAISRDEAWILTGGEGYVDPADPRGEKLLYSLKLWNAADETAAPIVIGGLKTLVTAMAFAPDSSTFYTGDKNGDGRIWDRKTVLADPMKAAPVAVLSGHTGQMVAATYLPNGKGLLTASRDNRVEHWDLTLSPPRPIANLALAHPKSVKALALSTSGKYALTSCEDNQVRLWDVSAAKTVRPPVNFVSHLPPPKPDDSTSAYLVKHGLNKDDKADKQRFGAVGAVAFSPDDSRAIFVFEEDRSVRAFPVDPAGAATTKVLLSFEKQPDVYVRSAVFRSDTELLTVGGTEARLWGAQAADPVEKRKFSPHATVASASFSRDRKRVVTASWDNTARIWNVEAVGPTGRDERQLRHEGQVNCAVFSPDDKFVLTGSDDKTARLWDAASGKELVRFVGHGGIVRWAAFSTDGKRVATASDDKIVRLWDVELAMPVADIKEPLKVEKVLGEFKGHTDAVLHVAFSQDKDGVRLVTGSNDRTARVWDVKSFACRLRLEGHTGPVNSTSFSPDGKRVVTGSEDFTAKIWDATERPEQKDELTGQEILTLKGHQREVTSVAFSSNGMHVLTGSRDNKAIVWTADTWPKGDPAKEEAAAKQASFIRP